MTKSFWKNKSVLLTGHTGFKGGWLALWLQSMGAEVHGYALAPSTEPNFFKLTGLLERMASHTIADIRDIEKLSNVMQSKCPEIIFHMAAQPLVRQSYANPIETYSTNVMGTVNVLEAARKSSVVRAIVNVTTDKCYENREWVWPYREDEALGGHDPYSSSKACSELITSAYRRSFLVASGIGVATARAGNVIGGGDWSVDRLIPDFFRSQNAHHPLMVRMPDAVRPWQHVLEPLSGYLILAERLYSDPLRYQGAWNFGPSDEAAKPVSWVLDKLSKDMPGESWRADKDNHLHEANLLKLDSSKAKTLLNWSPRWNLEETLKKVISWETERKSGSDLRRYSLMQINDYIGFINAI